jgi:flagellar protein FliO/FliZ
MTAVTAQSWFAIVIVLALVGTLAYLVRKGALGALARKGKVIQVETAVPLGDRRSLVVVAVEGRRLLLGLTPAQVSLVTELAPPQPFESALVKASADPSPLGNRV